jgi:S-adenosylmethionine synthetase
MPDGKTQVAVEYQDRRPARIQAVALTAALDPPTMPAAEKVHASLVEHVVGPTFAQQAIRPDQRTQILVNPGGPFLVGGPTRHAGLTGRKTAIDTYGEYARHSGAALSGKDPTRIDRVGAYAARWAAKNVVAAGLAEECEVHVSYMIGKAQPVSLQVETFGTGRLDDAALAARVANTFDFRLAAIIAAFDLRHRSSATDGGFFERLAAYGHVGRDDLELPWESVDRAAALRD